MKLGHGRTWPEGALPDCQTAGEGVLGWSPASGSRSQSAWCWARATSPSRNGQVASRMGSRPSSVRGAERCDPGRPPEAAGTTAGRPGFLAVVSRKRWMAASRDHLARSLRIVSWYRMALESPQKGEGSYRDRLGRGSRNDLTRRSQSANRPSGVAASGGNDLHGRPSRMAERRCVESNQETPGTAEGSLPQNPLAIGPSQQVI